MMTPEVRPHSTQASSSSTSSSPSSSASAESADDGLAGAAEPDFGLLLLVALSLGPAVALRVGRPPAATPAPSSFFRLLGWSAAALPLTASSVSPSAAGRLTSVVGGEHSSAAAQASCSSKIHSASAAVVHTCR